MDTTIPTYAIVVAAGQGSRLSGATAGVAKQFLMWQGRPLWWHSCRTFARVAPVCGIVLVLPPRASGPEFAAVEIMLPDLCRQDTVTLPVYLVEGGAARQESVYHALVFLENKLSGKNAVVMVHDAARPFVPASLIMDLWEKFGQTEGIHGLCPANSITDTVKQVAENCGIQATLPRETLVTVQTPQVFSFSVLLAAHNLALQQNFTGTDDIMLVEHAGLACAAWRTNAVNPKITQPEDLALLQEKPGYESVSGFGYDVHKYGGLRPLVLGGVLLPHTDVTVFAHSDGDVLIHALMDALLGLLATPDTPDTGDIGQRFPETDPRFEGVDSGILLADVMDEVRQKGLVIRHVDITLVAQKPKIAPFAVQIAHNVARLMGLEKHRVALKATTEEGLGFTGEGLGIKAYALVSAERPCW